MPIEPSPDKTPQAERAERHRKMLREAPEPVHICVWSDELSHSYRDVLALEAEVVRLRQERDEAKEEADDHFNQWKHIHGLYEAEQQKVERLREALQELLDSIPPRHAYDAELEAWEEAQDKAQAVLDSLDKP